jgi:protein-S-isoprenylcysteine O-methyltransferase Ste14
MKILQYLFVFLGSLIFFFIFYVIARTVSGVLPEILVLLDADFMIEILGLNFPFFDLFYVLFGLLIFTHGSLYLVHVHSFPDSLYQLIESDGQYADKGPYKKVRHPMYSSFIMIELGLFISLRSVYAIIFIILLWIIQSFAAIIEEEYALKKKYRDAFYAYASKVRRRFFSGALVFYTISAIIFKAIEIYTIIFLVES